MRRGIGWLLMCCLTWSTQAQNHELKSTVEIYQDLQEMQRGLRVLYLAAHPDDENTRLISWLENDQHVRTAYLSLTRGQGGQNLIGDEKGDGLGVIRTYELLEARKVDGGEQFFTRAIDFGYSKSAEESFEFWGKDEVLQDVVQVIRKFRPHVIITRFPPSRRAGHGHHEASAILAEEAFDLAGDPTAYPSQLEFLQPWTPTVLYHNTSSWWDKSLDEKSDAALIADKMHRVNVGVFNDLMGLGMNEIASMARSKHRCQAFGTPRSRGEQWEYLQFVKGTWSDDFLDGMAGVWERSPEHAAGLQRMIDEFSFTDRSANMDVFRRHVLPLLSQRSMWAESEDMQAVLQWVNDLKLALSGIRVEVYAGEAPVVIGTSYKATVEVYNAGEEDREVTFKHERIDTSFIVAKGQSISFEAEMKAPKTPSNPFWLRESHDGWRYAMGSKQDIGVASKHDEQVNYMIQIDKQWVVGASTMHRRWNDRSIGQIEEPMAFVQPVTFTPKVRSKVVRNGEVVTLEIVVKAFQDIVSLDMEVGHPKEFELVNADWPSGLLAGQERTVSLQFKANAMTANSMVTFAANVGGERCSMMQTAIDYEHIPFIFMHEPAQVNIIPLDLQFTPSKRILYVEGSGDEVDNALEEIGYQVFRTGLNQLSIDQLMSFDAVITGIRAFNRNDELAANAALLNEYVERGGKLIVQYNTTYDLKVEQIGPYPLTLSRDRVTDEHSTVEILKPKHDVFNRPNKMNDSDWEGWVQERGLYFAGEWDAKYTPLVSWSDKGEEPALGGLLVAKKGEGDVVYTGISFFRQLPAGVTGAYKLMVNLIEY
ncbi:MAG: PIG-L family deacetylase [Cryomorphaceae bacterium]